MQRTKLAKLLATINKGGLCGHIHSAWLPSWSVKHFMGTTWRAETAGKNRLPSSHVQNVLFCPTSLLDLPNLSLDTDTKFISKTRYNMLTT